MVERWARVGFVLVLAAAWVALWGDLSWANVLAGLVIGVLGLVLTPWPDRSDGHRFSLPGLLRYLLYFTRALVVATVDVAVRALRSPDLLRPAVIGLDAGCTDPFILTIVANSVTLTPGTVTLDVDVERGILYIHCLHLPDEAAEQAMLSEVLRFRDLALGVLRPVPGTGRDRPAGKEQP